MTTTILRADELARILEQTAPHRSEPTSWKPGAITLLDADTTHLHAVTTCRYTLAVASAPACGRAGGDGEAWTATIQGHDADSLAAWARSRGYDEDVSLIVAADRVEAFTPTSALRVPVSASPFPVTEWRQLLAAELDGPTDSTAAPTALDTELLRRWSDSGDIVWLGQSRRSGHLLVLGEDFAGVQMPVKKDWAAPSGPAWAAGDGAPVATLPLPDPDDDLARLQSEMLQRVVLADESAKDAYAVGDRAAAAAIVTAAGSAYLAFQALRALEEIDPRRAHRLAAQVCDDFDSGEFTETAYQAAQADGLDPSAWVAGYHWVAAQAAAQQS
ncbi:hypothetical protein [Kitasatospora sp. NPDC127060]|uniref:hypothetical protein n=1 Tax=Kitasatospora sp. NPDC127060 TaxID=3347121 RepID=UPI0036526F7A